MTLSGELAALLGEDVTGGKPRAVIGLDTGRPCYAVEIGLGEIGLLPIEDRALRDEVNCAIAQQAIVGSAHYQPSRGERFRFLSRSEQLPGHETGD